MNTYMAGGGTQIGDSQVGSNKGIIRSVWLPYEGGVRNVVQTETHTKRRMMIVENQRGGCLRCL